MNILLQNHSSYPLALQSRAGADGVSALIAEQAAAGMDVVTDGQQATDNPWLSFLPTLEGVVSGEHLDTGYWHCPQPLVVGRLGYRSGAVQSAQFAIGAACGKGTAWKAVLPGPYSVSGLSRIDGAPYAGVEALAFAFAEATALAVAELAAAGAEYIQIEEPAVLHPEADFRLLRRLWELLWNARGASTLIMATYLGDAEEVYAQINTIAADGLAVDVASSPALVEVIAATGSGLPLVLGICDGQRAELESAAMLAQTFERLLAHYCFDRIDLQPSCGLGGLSPSAARAKLQLLSVVRQRVEGSIVEGEAAAGMNS